MPRRSSKTPWQNPVVIRPWLGAMSWGDAVRIPLFPKTPREVLNRHSMPEIYGSGFGAHVAVDEASLVIHAGPLDMAFDDEPALATLLRALAPYLPDLHIWSHDEEGVRCTLTEGLITEFRVRSGVATITQHPIEIAIPRARYLDTRQGCQGFPTQLELLLMLAGRPDAPAALVELCRAEAVFDVDVTERQTTGSTEDLWNTEPARQHLETIAALGQDVTAASSRLAAVERRAIEHLLGWLTATRSPTPETPDQLARLLGPGSPLAVVLGSLGPGVLPGGCLLWSSSEILDRAERREAEPDWPSELVAVGQRDGVTMCLDRRFRPAPVIMEIGEPERRFVESAGGLYGLLAWHSPRGS